MAAKDVKILPSFVGTLNLFKEEAEAFISAVERGDPRAEENGEELEKKFGAAEGQIEALRNRIEDPALFLKGLREIHGECVLAASEMKLEFRRLHKRGIASGPGDLKIYVDLLDVLCDYIVDVEETWQETQPKKGEEGSEGKESSPLMGISRVH